jgi:hypothetical protein
MIAAISAEFANDGPKTSRPGSRTSLAWTAHAFSRPDVKGARGALPRYTEFGGAVMWNMAPYSLKSRDPTAPVSSKRSG